MKIVITFIGNILNHSFCSKSFYHYVKAFYDFEKIFIKLDEAELKLEELRGKKNQSYTVEFHKRGSTSFPLRMLFKRSFN